MIPAVWAASNASAIRLVQGDVLHAAPAFQVAAARMFH
jgi:hypothetical protein